MQKKEPVLIAQSRERMPDYLFYATLQHLETTSGDRLSRNLHEPLPQSLA
jgi:hypothetical protein